MAPTKKLLFIGLNYDQIPYLSAARQLGFEPVGVDRNPAAVGSKLVSSHLVVDYEDVSSIIEHGSSHGFGSDSKVFSAASQNSFVTLAHFAEQFGIPYPGSESIRCCLDKSMTYEIFSKFGVNFPETKIFDREVDLRDFLASAKNGKWFGKYDFSKTPIGIFGISKEDDIDKISWERSSFFRNRFLLQSAVEGKEFRINYFDGNLLVFEHKSGRKVTDRSLYSNLDGLGRALTAIVDHLALHRFIIKVDVIVSGANYYALDLGIDPPSRLLANFGDKARFYEAFFKRQIGEGDFTFQEYADEFFS